MSREFGPRDIVAAATKQNQHIDVQLVEFKNRDAKHAEEMAGLKKELQAAWDNLVEQVVPSLDPASLDAAAARLMLPQLSSARAQTFITQERATQEGVIRRVDADPEYAHRVARGLQLRTELRELLEYIQPLRQSVDPLEQHPHFLQLFRDGYGSESYNKGWWTLSYYRDWKNGDLVVEQFGKALQATDFAGLAARYREDHANLGVLERKAEALKRQQEAIAALEQERARAVEALGKIPERVLTMARAAVREHLERLDDAERLKLFDAPALQLASKRISGVDAKTKYLEGLHQEMVVKPREELVRMKEKNARDIQKMMMPKKQGFRMTQEDYDRRFRDRHDAWNKRWERYDTTRNQIIVYERYETYDPVADIIWWDIMTDGRLDGHFIPEVHHHHDVYGFHHHHHHHHDDVYEAVAYDSGSTLHHRDIS